VKGSKYELAEVEGWGVCVQPRPGLAKRLASWLLVCMYCAILVALHIVFGGV